MDTELPFLNSYPLLNLNLFLKIADNLSLLSIIDDLILLSELLLS